MVLTNNLRAKEKIACIICGMAAGADMLGRRWAHENALAVVEMPADWEKHGRSAGYIRNEEMAKKADQVVVFWDGLSKGSKNMIDLAIKYGKPCLVFITPNSKLVEAEL